MNRGEVWWAELAGDAGYRPVAIVSRTSPEHWRKIIVAEVTTVIRSLPSEVPLSQADSMPEPCVINTDNMQTIARERLRSRMIALRDERIFALANALPCSLDLEW